MPVTVVIPWSGGCEHRERALAWVRMQYAQRHPSWDVVIGETSGAWCKARAVMPAIHDAPDGIVIVADADVWTEGLDEAVTAVQDGAGWSQPHTLVRRLTEQATTQLLEHDPWSYLPLDRPIYKGVDGGGIVVAHRDTILDCPLDPRFIGWGQEDVSWSVALRTLHGREWRGTSDLIHLFHPAQPRANRKIGSIAGQALFRRYMKARRSPAQMRALIREVEPCRSQPS